MGLEAFLFFAYAIFTRDNTSKIDKRRLPEKINNQNENIAQNINQTKWVR